ncbi:ATP-binding protein [Streptomyces sp. NPDC003717]|uniref:ATP-binding protein n=1 Tax=Streptomyces sp. NPDC003717 TaxID=3154276 RepID=UPI0033AE76DB
MDPTNRGAEEYGPDGEGHAPRPRPARDPLTPDFGHPAAPARTARLVSGEFLLTVNPVDGSEIEACPPADRPSAPRRRDAQGRAEADRAARPPVPPGPAAPELPLLARQEERERLVRLLARGRSVRLTGPAGSGRTSLLDVVAEDCADLAPDGVVRLSGLRRTADDLLHDLFHAVHDAPRHRPSRETLLGAVREVGAVVVLDDLEFGGTALDDLLDATPECAFLLAATPDVPAPSADSAVEEVFLTGLDRADGVRLLERAAGRTLTEEEANWAGDLWFESEGLPLRFVQAGALLRRRDRLRADADAVDEYGVFAGPRTADEGPQDQVPHEAAEGDDVPLPSLGEAAAPAPLLAARLSGAARTTLEFAVALGGEVPHQAHLPALVGDTHADAALGELAGCGLISPAGAHYRLAAGVLAQLADAGYADDSGERLRTAARHYAWWAGHPSVTPERVSAEADAVLAALTALAPAAAPPADGEADPAVLLARTAAPAFAAGPQWGAWERALRSGTQAARLAGDVAEQAYFHHELGVLALCEGHLDRARAELEASIGLRGALSDKRGAVAGRRALALVADRAGDTPGLTASAGPLGIAGAALALGGGAAEETPDPWPDTRAATSAEAGTRADAGGEGRPDAGTGAWPYILPGDARPGAGPGSDALADGPATPVGGMPVPFPPLQPSPHSPTLVTRRDDPNAGPHRKTGGVRGFARRNLVAAGAGALLVAVLGTVVTLGATSENGAGDPADHVGGNPSSSQGVDDGGLDAGPPTDDANADPAADTPTVRPTDPGPDGTLGTADDPTPTAPTRPSGGPSATGDPGDDPEEPGDTGAPTRPGTPSSPGRPTTPTKSPKPTKPTTPPTTPTKPPTQTPSSPSPTPSETEPAPPAPPPAEPQTSGTASRPMASTPADSAAPSETGQVA